MSVGIVEEFRPILGYEKYIVSSNGKIWSNKSQKYLIPKITNNGYLSVNLYSGAIMTAIVIHKLVAENFIGPCPKGHQIRHLDGNKHNNCVTNLKYGTPLENQRDRDIHGTNNIGERNGRAILNRQKVNEIREKYKNGITTIQLADEYKINRDYIYNIINYKVWK